MSEPSTRPRLGEPAAGWPARGDEEAVRQLWRRYFQPLVRLARGRLSARICGVRDAEDVALDAFAELCQRMARQRSADSFPQLHNRTHLWKLLACFAARRAFDLARKEQRRRRLWATRRSWAAEGFEPFVGREPTPEFSAAVADLLECLPSDELRPWPWPRWKAALTPRPAGGWAAPSAPWSGSCKSSACSGVMPEETYHDSDPSTRPRAAGRSARRAGAGGGCPVRRLRASLAASPPLRRCRAGPRNVHGSRHPGRPRRSGGVPAGTGERTARRPGAAGHPA